MNLQFSFHNMILVDFIWFFFDYTPYAFLQLKRFSFKAKLYICF